MKVNLAAQTISNGVADAIDFLRCAGFAQFHDSQETCKFIRIFDRLFDMQNSRNAFGTGFKSPLSLSNQKMWTQVFDECEGYIRSLQIDDRSIFNHSRKMFALGFLINIQSFRNLALDLLTQIPHPLKYFLTYKCSQDHLEFLLSKIIWWLE